MYLVNTVTHYTVSRSSHGWALVAEHTNGDGTLIGYFPTKSEALAVRADLVSLRAAKAAR